jgi:2-phosphoglycerate kinase
MTASPAPDWTVLLIGGPSGVGKSTVAKQIARRFGVGEVLSPAIAKVITNHLAIAEPIVIEGDGILPSVFAAPEVQHYATLTGRRVRMVFVVPSDEHAILANMMQRARGTHGRDDEELRADAQANCLFGKWFANEAKRAGLPVLDSLPWETLGDRILAATNEGRA